MLKSINKQTKGFTIIEVMIVLAIAGLIMLIVFLAVPALQRNQRNTTRKSEVSRIATAVSNYVSNNNGAVPQPTNTAAGRTAAQSILDDTGTLSQLAGIVVNPTDVPTAHRFSIHQGANATVPTIAIAGPAAPTDAVTLNTAAACGPNGTTIAGPSARSMALQYTLEPGSSATGNYQNACLDI